MSVFVCSKLPLPTWNDQGLAILGQHHSRATEWLCLNRVGNCSATRQKVYIIQDSIAGYVSFGLNAVLDLAEPPFVDYRQLINNFFCRVTGVTRLLLLECLIWST